MHSKIMGLIAVMGMMSSVAFAEPAIQPGDTLESLSKARITTNVNSQAATPTPQKVWQAILMLKLKSRISTRSLKKNRRSRNSKSSCTTSDSSYCRGCSSSSCIKRTYCKC